MHTTSASLLMRLKQPGQAEAWSRFVRLYSPLLYTWGKRLGLQTADAADLVQDVFTTLVQKLPEFSYDDHKRFRGWLWTVTKNRLRERRRRKTIQANGDEAIDQHAATNAETVEDELFRRHMLGEILPTLADQFEPKTWKSFWEYYVEGRPAKEVAAELGLGVGAIYMAKLRVLGRLHKELQDLIDE